MKRLKRHSHNFIIDDDLLELCYILAITYFLQKVSLEVSLKRKTAKDCRQLARSIRRGRLQERASLIRTLPASRTTPRRILESVLFRS